ncbi:MAG TPA: hypothetical protein VN812_09940 [Candidatus Acidoferrales bacterium]|nr:hypothetical protein [Candidatus Acidoferrales bacterium]
MKRPLLVAVALATLFTLRPGFARAADDAPQAPAAAQAAQAADQPAQPTAGCMPGGGCCGSAECAQMMGAEHPAAAGDSAADATGGCPCIKSRAKAQKTE